MKRISLRATAVAVATLATCQAWATNGMLMEGYGPIALSMGGAAQAYDNGTAAMINNVATLQLGENGTRADAALGVLGPNVTAMGERSGGTSYVMPAVGWTRKNDQFTYGVGVMGQGGMGTEYSASTLMAMGTGEPVRSELAVGRVIFPISYKVNSQLNVGASLDYTWSSLDMRMAATLGQLGLMYTGGTDGFSPQNLQAAMGQLTQANVSTARIDFSNNNDFTGAAKSTGFTGKLGMTYALDNTLTLGASYHLKTRLGDMKTSANGATLTMGQAMTGQMVIHNFQMPSTLALGAAWKVNSKLMLAADVKTIDWSSVMESFKMSFSNAGGTVDFAMPQNWKDQRVLSLGGAYQINDTLVLRAGYSHSTNPVPAATVHPLFPAIVKDHYTAGFGYQIDKNMSITAAVSHAPKVTVAADQLLGQPITHSQTNYQLMLSVRY
jgi:long-chain fatty acid transport protein